MSLSVHEADALREVFVAICRALRKMPHDSPWRHGLQIQATILSEALGRSPVTPLRTPGPAPLESDSRSLEEPARAG